VSFMKGGLNYSDWITTVSPTYAQEIQDPFYGANLEGVLRRRQGQLSGILNGLDYEEWDPHTDPYLKENYTFRSTKRKFRNKQHLQERLGLPEDGDIPMIAMITRLVPQKGIDLVVRVMEEILQLGVQFVVLGTGEARYEDFFRWAAERHPQQVSAKIMFNNELAHQIYAAADLFLMPSLFEPCGLSQLMALRYGALPIVRETGGLKDTVLSYNEVTGEGNGFSFANYNAHDMLYTIERAVRFFHDRANGVWDTLVKRAMKCDFSWEKSAKEYAALYEEVLGKGAAM
jgi:starch synthase